MLSYLEHHNSWKRNCDLRISTSGYQKLGLLNNSENQNNIRNDEQIILNVSIILMIP